MGCRRLRSTTRKWTTNNFLLSMKQVARSQRRYEKRLKDWCILSKMEELRRYSGLTSFMVISFLLLQLMVLNRKNPGTKVQTNTAMYFFGRLPNSSGVWELKITPHSFG